MPKHYDLNLKSETRYMGPRILLLQNKAFLKSKTVYLFLFNDILLISIKNNKLFWSKYVYSLYCKVLIIEI